MRNARASAATALLVIAATGLGYACSGSDGSPDSVRLAATQDDPAGNDGTVKIEEFGSTTEMPDNHPHTSCHLVIEFRGYDKGDLTATWSLAGQEPSGTAEIASGSAFIGEDDAGGATDLDASVDVVITDTMLGALTPQENQGYHLKLTVHAPGSENGRDTKFKVFWVDGCPTTEDGGAPSDGGAPTDGGGPPPTDGGGPPPTDAGPPPSGGDAGPSDGGQPPKMW